MRNLHKTMSCRVSVALSLFLFLLCVIPAKAQLQAQWAVPTGGAGVNQQGWRVAIGPAAEVYQLGAFEGEIILGTDTLHSVGQRNGFLARYDSIGNLIWVKQLAGPGTVVPLSISVSQTGHILVCGFFTDTCVIGSEEFISHGNEDLFICQYAPSGSLEWAKSAGSPNFDRAEAVLADSAGGGWVTGSIHGFVHFGSIGVQYQNILPGFVLARFDAQGNYTMVRTANGSQYAGVIGNGLAFDAEGNCFVTGVYNHRVYFDNIPIGDEDAWGNYSFLAKFNPLGEALWVRTFGSSWGDAAHNVKTDASGNAYVAGRFNTTWYAYNTANTDPMLSSQFWASGSYQSGFLAKYSPTGEFKWVIGSEPFSNMEIGDSEYDDLHVTPDGTSYVTGFYVGHLRFGNHTVNIPYSGADDALVASFDSAGNPLWAYGYATGHHFSRGQGLALGPNNSLYLSGYFQDTANFAPATTLISAGGADAFLARFSLPTVNATPDLSLPLQTVLIYPNPSAGSFTVQLPGALTKQAELRLFNEVGQLVYRQTLQPNVQRAFIQTSGLAKGLYQVQIGSEKQLYQSRVLIQ